MAHCPGDNSNWLSSFEEECVGDLEAGGDFEEELLVDKELAARRLWLTFQESANAVSQFYRDCQQKAGPSAWTPFHESASAVTQLYKDALEVCRAGMEAGIQQGQKKRNREIMAWAKKKRKVIKREELLAFLSNRPYRETSPLYNNNNNLPDTSGHLFSNSDQILTSNNNSNMFGRTQGPGLPTTCNFVSTNCSSPYHGSAMLSPRRSKSILRDDPMSLSEDIRDSSGSRKRQINLAFDYAMEQPLPKRGRL